MRSIEKHYTGDGPGFIDIESRPKVQLSDGSQYTGQWKISTGQMHGEGR